MHPSINDTHPFLKSDRTDAALRWLAAIVDSSDDPILSKDLDGIITSWNNGAERIFGYKPEEVVGRPITMLMPPDRFNEEPGILARIRRGERIEHYETIRKKKDGTLINISLTVSPIKDANGNVIGASKIARDITANKRAEEALKQSQQKLAVLNEELKKAKENLETEVQIRTAELAQTNEQLEELVYTIAHDLRAPLRAMQAFATLLQNDYEHCLDETARAYCQRIVRATNSMDAMILDLLAYGRVSSGHMALGPVSSRSAWENAVYQNEQMIRKKSALVEAASPLPDVIAHESTLTQIFANLLNNGLKFVAPNVNPHVKLWTEEAGSDFVRFNVCDTGVGIPSQHLNRIFRVFERLDGDHYPGTGIGLSIVRKGVERMGGHVGVESTLGQGSRFWIELRKAV